MLHVKEIRYLLGLHDGFAHDKQDLKRSEYDLIFFDEIEDWLNTE